MNNMGLILEGAATGRPEAFHTTEIKSEDFIVIFASPKSRKCP
jgi:hypothetical protein